MIKRKIYRFRQGEILDIEEYHDGQYGAPGQKRKKKKEITPEQIARVNAENKKRRCRHRLLEYFNPNDWFLTWTYSIENRPDDMRGAKKDFQKSIRKVRKGYAKRESELRWIRNIERGTKGAWHIHLVVNDIQDTASILCDAWTKGAVYLTRIKNNSKIYDPDFTKLASYMTKSETTEEVNGSGQKSRIKESSYSTSRNMPLPEPKIQKLHRWKADPKPKKGYYIVSIVEGVNPVTGFLYRRYTQARLSDLRSSA